MGRSRKKAAFCPFVASKSPRSNLAELFQETPGPRAGAPEICLECAVTEQQPALLPSAAGADVAALRAPPATA